MPESSEASRRERPTVELGPNGRNPSERAGGAIAEHSAEESAPSCERFAEPDPLTTEGRVCQDGIVTAAAAAAASPTSAPNAGEAFIHPSFRDTLRKLNEYSDTLRELQRLGLSHDIQLPEVVIVGDRWTGKSSLVSGLLNLDLPRSEGTCTRCPLHIRVSRHTESSCRVWLRKEYSYTPPLDRAIDESDVTDRDPFLPWRKLPSTVIHEFKSIHDKSEVEDVLRWAQIAILNDKKHHGLFVPGYGSIATNTPIAKATEETVAKFSPNIVTLEIKGPGLLDLSLYDMPGIFQNPADARDDYLVNDVRNLSSAYMSHPSAIIICSMPMNSDADNSATFGLTRSLGASGRTIGVLTKADLLPQGSTSNHDQWLTVMKGDAYQTGLGYFITSRPREKDWEEQKQWEELVFEDWPEELYQFSDRCGVEKLRAFLLERIVEEFAKSLLNVKRTVKLYFDSTAEQLASLFPLHQTCDRLEIQNGLTIFTDVARAKMNTFVESFVLPRNLRDCLLYMRPAFNLDDWSDHTTIDAPGHEADDLSTAVSIAPTARRRASRAASSMRLRLGANAAAPASLGSPPPGRSHSLTTVPTLPAPFTNFAPVVGRLYTLRGVREEMQAKSIAGMPDRISDEVYIDLVKLAVEPWNGPMNAFIKQTMKDLHSELDATLGEALGNLKGRLLYQEVKRHVHTCLEEHGHEAEAALLGLYNDERGRLLTFNEETFKRYYDDEHIMLTRFRHNMRMEAAGFVTRPALPSDQSNQIWVKI